MQSLRKQYHGWIPVIQKEMSAIVEKDIRLKGEVTQLSRLSCNCGFANFTWHFPFFMLLYSPSIVHLFFYIKGTVAVILNILGLTYTYRWAFSFETIWVILVVVTWFVSDVYLGCTWWNYS